MASRKTTGLFYNLILTLALFLLLMTSLLGLEIPTTVALEQSPRCGQAEHHHSEDCYLGEVLLCTQKAHTHSQSCYLVDLRDNDINALLQSLGEGSDGSLEELIRSVMGRALNSSPDYDADSALMRLRQEDITALNDTIRSDESIPKLLLNQNLGTGITLQYAPVEGIVTFGINDTVGTEGHVNFYVWLDGSHFAFIGKLEAVDSGYYDYLTKSDIASLLSTNEIVSNIDADNMETGWGSSDGYQLRYTTTKPTTTTVASVFSTNGNRDTWTADNISFGNMINGSYYSPRYVTIMTGDSNVYTPVSFYTVTLDYTNCGDDTPANQVQYVQSGLASTLTLSDQYDWVDKDGKSATLPTTITATTTLYARPKAAPGYTVTFSENYQGGQTHDVTVEKNAAIPEGDIPDVSRTGYTFGGWYTDANCTDGNQYDFNAAVNANLDLYAKWIPNVYTVTVLNEDGTVADTDYVRHGNTFTLGDLPEGYVWDDGNGNTYPTGATVKIEKNMTFKASAKPLKVSYVVSFPTNDDLEKVGLTLRTAGTEPTVIGGAEASVTSGISHRIRDVSDRNVDLQLPEVGGRYGAAHFQGWKTESGDILQPGAALGYGEMNAYDANGDGTVTLTGQWSYARITSVNFFIRYDIGTNTGLTNSNLYTDVVFTTYLCGLEDMDFTSYNLSDLNNAHALGLTSGNLDYNAEQYYTYDQSIRALYGSRATGVWLPEFPDDAAMLEVLKTTNTGSTLYAVEASTGKTVAVNRDELTTDNYTIRWYMFKSVWEGVGANDTWHIDGLLVKKQGQITVTKQFLGDANAIAQAEQSFAINADGERDVTLTIDGANADNSVPADHKYVWELDGISNNSTWTFAENATILKGYSLYSEHSVRDTGKDSSNKVNITAQSGTSVTITGKTYALDEDPDQGLFVDFTNYYYPEDSILLKKEDGLTGAGIGGAEFMVQQTIYSDGPQPQFLNLKFNYDPDTGVYTQSPNGTHDTIKTSDDGFVVIRGFSYQHGNTAGTENETYLTGGIIITETLSPTGYSPAPEIALGLDENHNVVIRTVGELDESEWEKYAELPSNEVLEIRNYNTDYVSVTVNKVWDTITPEESVDVVLQANGHHAGLEIPSLTNAQVVLNAANNWTYTWNDLPRYANGTEVTWGIKEVKVGNAPTLADGVSFANWVPTYSDPVESDTDTDGKTDNWSFTVTNTKRRNMLTVTKVDNNGTVLPGATFKLENVKRPDSSRTQTTDENGRTTFENMGSGDWYRLTEISAPAGYVILAEPVVLSVDSAGKVWKVEDDGTLTELNEPYLTHTGPYNIRVTNLKPEPLPETGGAGTQRYTRSGLLLIVLAAALWIYSRLPGIPALAAPRGQRRKFRQISNFRMLPPGPGPAPAEPVPRQDPKTHRKEESDTS